MITVRGVDYVETQIIAKIRKDTSKRTSAWYFWIWLVLDSDREKVVMQLDYDDEYDDWETCVKSAIASRQVVIGFAYKVGLFPVMPASEVRVP